MGILPFLLTATTATAPVQPAALQARAPTTAEHPALWVVNDHDTIIYLFGTFHALDGKSQWFDQAVKTAFSESNELMLETVIPKPEQAASAKSSNSARGQSSAHGFIPGTHDGPVVQLAPSANFLATTKLVMTAGRTKGMSTAKGADAVLRDAAEEAGKPVGGLESLEFQMNMYTSLPASPAKPAQVRDPKTLQALANVLSHLQSAWNRGAVEETFTPLLHQMQAQTPQTYRTMFVERNARWANWIADRLNSPGTVFVAVGAGHLSGPDSVQKQLSTLGVKSARIN